MPRQTYRKLTELVREAREGLRVKMEEPGGEVYRKLFSRDLESLNELTVALEKYRSVFFKTIGIKDGGHTSGQGKGTHLFQRNVPDGMSPTNEEEQEEPGVVEAAGHPEIFNEEEEDEWGRVVGEFSRLPKGGTIYNPAGDDIFVPEIWVRNLSIEHRDVVSAVPLGTLDQDVQLYEFAVLERLGMGATSNRVSIVGPVYRHGPDWFVYSEEEGTVISLKPKEVRTLGLTEGDTVEVAYPRGELSQARIAWKYDHTPYRDEIRERARREKADKPGQIVDIGDPLLSGRAVLVIGGDLYKDAFRQNFTRRGAEFLWESGFQGGEGKNIESKVRASDVVVIVTEMMSHRIPNIEAMCKKHGKPYVYAPSKGSTGAVRECQKVLAKAAPGSR